MQVSNTGRLYDDYAISMDRARAEGHSQLGTRRSFVRDISPNALIE